MSPVLFFIGLLFVGILAIVGVAVVAWVRDENRKDANRLRGETDRLRHGLVNAERALRAIANGSTDPTNEASIALYDIEATLYKELEK